MILGERMSHHGKVECDCNTDDPENCPFCADRTAYKIYLNKTLKGIS